jgi:hypothetical protein
MALHLIKLCVGVDSVAELATWQQRRRARPRRVDGPSEPYHTTRMTPSRRDEVLDGGSLYWVIRRLAAVRQRVVDLAEVTADDGTKRCAIVLDPELVLTEPVPRKPFQGWRYLDPQDAPADLAALGEGGGELPESLRRKLVELGAW